jgi:anti-anti-sigma regulatory factor
MDMTVSQADDGVSRVVLDGRFDIHGAQQVDARFGELAESSKALIVDLAKVSFLASLGVRTLMLSAKTRGFTPTSIQRPARCGNA